MTRRRPHLEWAPKPLADESLTLARMTAYSDADSALLHQAHAQSGAFTRQQAQDCGLTDRQINHRVASGAWGRLLPTVYVLEAAPLTWLTWAWAGILSAGPGSTLVASSAAAARGWVQQTWPITIAIPTAKRRRWKTSRLSLLRLDVPEDDVVKVNGLPCTTRLRTATDIAHLLPLAHAQQLLDRLLVLEIIDLPSLTRSVESSLRNGSRQARRLVASAADLAASEAERLCHRLLKEAELDWFEANYTVSAAGTSHKVDIAFVRERVAIEIQGWAFHRTPERRAADDAKAIDLQLAGWMVIPVTWHDLNSRPDYVVARIRAALIERAVD